MISSTNDLNPIQKHLIAMILLHLKVSNDNSVSIYFKNAYNFNKKFANLKLTDLDVFIDSFLKYDCGTIIFTDYILGTFSFQFSYSGNDIYFDPYLVPNISAKYVSDLFQEAGFIVNIDMLDYWIEYYEKNRCNS